MRELNGIDLFAGAGGLSEGFIQAGGFKIIATIEKDYWACETQKTRHIFHYLKSVNRLDDYWEYCRNTTSLNQIIPNRNKIYEKHRELEDDIKHTIWQAEFGNPQKNQNASTSKEVIQHLENSVKYHKKPDIDFILGGPPCQVYSLVGRGRMKEFAKDDERNFLFRFYFDIVKHFKPRFFLFENVPGILSARNGEIFKMIQDDFDRIGYAFVSGRNNGNIQKNIQNAFDFGVPQNRKRLIFLGIRSDVALEYPLFGTKSIVPETLFTKNVISDLPKLKPDSGQDHGVIDYDKDPVSSYQEEIRQDSSGVMNHRARPLNKSYDQQIYKIAITMARRRKQLDYSTLPEDLKTHKNESSFVDRFKVHWWNETPHTIVAHIAKDGHYNIHPDKKQLRSITVREAARIQSFPDNFRFEGFRTAQFVQVGNAVPPKMARAFAEAIKKQLK